MYTSSAYGHTLLVHVSCTDSPITRATARLFPSSGVANASMGQEPSAEAADGDGDLRSKRGRRVADVDANCIASFVYIKKRKKCILRKLVKKINT